MRNADMPAMPTDALHMPDYDDASNDELIPRNGLTKREHFAALAMQGLMGLSVSLDAIQIAEAAIDQADALLAELEKTK